MELNIDHLIKDLDQMLNSDQNQEGFISVFKVLVKLFSVLKTNTDSKIKSSFNQLTRLAHEHPGFYDKYFSVLFSSEVLQCKDHCIAVSKTLGNVGKFLSQHGDLDTCLSILYWPNGSINNDLISAGGESLCKGIIDVVCRSDHTVKAIVELRNTISKISDVLELLFSEDALLEKLCTKNIFSHLFTNARLKCEKKKSEPILPLLVGGILQHLDLCLIEEVVQSTLSEFLQASPNIDQKDRQNEILIAVGSCLFQWINLPYSSNASWIVLIYCRTLVSCKCLVPLMNILNKEMDKLLLFIKLPIMRSSSLHLYMNLQLSFKTNHVFFKKHCKELASLIIHLKQVKGQDAASSATAAHRLILMTKYLFQIHPQMIEISPALFQLIENMPPSLKLAHSASLPKEMSGVFQILEIHVTSTASYSACLLALGLYKGDIYQLRQQLQTTFEGFFDSFSREVLQSPLYSGQFSKSLQVTFANLLMSKGMTHTPKEVVDCSTKFFSLGLQHDCSEFLTHYLDVMSEELSQAGESIVSRYFHGHMRNTIKCLECGAQSNKVEHFSDLPITIPTDGREAPDTSHDLSALIKNHFEEETLEGDNMYLCDHCKKTVRATKSHFIIKAPKYLVVMLLRFRFDHRSNCRRKVTPMINCSRSIELSLKEDGENTQTPSDSEQEYGGTRNILYELKAMTIHSGTSLESGHYYSLILFPDSHSGQESNDLWHLIDDNDVRCISTQEFSRIACGTPIQTPYVLFYAKHDIASSLPLSEEDVVPCLKKMVEEQNKNFKNQKKPRGSSANHPTLSRRSPDQNDDDEDENTTTKSFHDGPRLIF